MPLVLVLGAAGLLVLWRTGKLSSARSPRAAVPVPEWLPAQPPGYTPPASQASQPSQHRDGSPTSGARSPSRPQASEAAAGPSPEGQVRVSEVRPGAAGQVQVPQGPPPLPEGTIEVRYLGPVEVVGLPGDARLSGPELELLAFLAACPGNWSSAGVLRDALDVGRDERTEETIRNYINNLRRAIGADHLPDAKKAGRYRLVGVSTDEARFRALATKATTDPGLAVEHLATALSLVRGEPFANRPAGRYAWAYETPVVTSLANHVRTSAIKLGELALDASNTALATWAAEQALRACPKEFELLELKLRAGALAGRGTLNRAWIEVTKCFQGPDDKVPPELVAFYEAEIRKVRPQQAVE